MEKVNLGTAPSHIRKFTQHVPKRVVSLGGSDYLVEKRREFACWTCRRWRLRASFGLTEVRDFSFETVGSAHLEAKKTFHGAGHTEAINCLHGDREVKKIYRDWAGHESQS